MTAQQELFGVYVPGDSVVHRTPAGAKLLVIVLVSFALLWARSLPAAGVVGGVVVAVLLVARVPWRKAFWIPWSLLLMLAALFVAQLWWSSWQEGALVAANVVVCLYASRILTLTSPVPDLLDALVAALRPLRLVGADPERIGLAAALMLRSIPFLFGAFTDVRDAARARGIERNVFARVTPVVVSAVAYAQATGEALAARGLGEGDDEPIR